MRFSLPVAALLGGAVSALPAQEPATPPAAPRRPNLVLFLADDLGCADLSATGAPDFATPHLDALLRSGVRCTAAYSTAPMCAPSRAALLTGRHQQRFGFEFNQGQGENKAANFGLPADQPTLAERLRAAGYSTGMVGKWHLGDQPGQRPTERGFDEFFGFHDNASHYDPRLRRPNRYPLQRGTREVSDREWLMPACTREAVAFIARHAAAPDRKPFLLYAAWPAAHVPLEIDPAVADRVAAIEDPQRRAYASLVVALDDAVGAVMAKLSESGLERDTLVLFLSDNGALRPPSNGATRGGKTSLWEGGIRVPLVASWPGHLPAGASFHHPVSGIDVAPTLLAAAGIPPPSVDAPAFDGVDLLPHLTGAIAAPPHAHLFWRTGSRFAVRAGDWKLVAGLANGEAGLFNLVEDPYERHDLSAAEPERRAELKRAWDEWNGSNVAPKWQGKEDLEEAPEPRRPPARERSRDGG
jgi:arylsulfatase A-like enzyme